MIISNPLLLSSCNVVDSNIHPSMFCNLFLSQVHAHDPLRMPCPKKRRGIRVAGTPICNEKEQRWDLSKIITKRFVSKTPERSIEHTEHEGARRDAFTRVPKEKGIPRSHAWIEARIEANR